MHGYACIIGTLAGDTWPIIVERLSRWLTTEFDYVSENGCPFNRVKNRGSWGKEEVLKNSSYRGKLYSLFVHVFN